MYITTPLTILVLFFGSFVLVTWLKQREKKMIYITLTKGVMSGLGLLFVVTSVLWLLDAAITDSIFLRYLLR